MNRQLFIVSLILMAEIISAQTNSEWDDTNNKSWPVEFEVVDIPSSLDGTNQKTYVYFPASDNPKPLIVSLHTWSGNYTQKDPLVKQILENQWNYIHPDFRGANNNPKACGSEFVLADIDDAISFAIENGNVDLEQIHVVGASGGGFATMLAYMKSAHDIKTFSSWVGISDLVKWYYESLGRGNKYARHIALATTGDTITIDEKEAKKRSPFFMDTPVQKRQNSKFYLYCGIHDGYTGSVPITQTIDFYNKLATDVQPENEKSLVPQKVRETMLRQRNLPGLELHEKLGNRKIWYKNSCRDKIFLTVFEGGHEMVVEAGLHAAIESTMNAKK